MAVFWVGYAKLEDLCMAMMPGKPVSVMALTQPGSRGKHPGVRFDTDVVMVSQGQSDGELRYCQISTGKWPMVADQMLDTDPTAPKARAERIMSAFRLIKAFLVSQGFPVREAVYAAPHNLQYLEGRAEFMAFDEEKGRYIPGPGHEAIVAYMVGEAAADLPRAG